MSPTNADHLSILTSVPHEGTAGIIVAALEREGVRAKAVGMHSAGLRVSAYGWVQVLVSEDDLPRARELLQQIELGGEAIDWSTVDVGAPADQP